MRISDWSSDVCSSDLPLKHRLDQVRIGNIDRHCNSSRAHPLDEMCSLFSGGGLNVSDDNGFSASGGGQHGARSSDPSPRPSSHGDLSDEHPAIIHAISHLGIVVYRHAFMRSYRRSSKVDSKYRIDSTSSDAF